MKKRNWIFLSVRVGIVAAAAFVTRSSWMGGSAAPRAPQRPRMVSVELAKAERKPVPVDVDAIGMVTPISSVALKSRLETTIVSVHFEDGAKVNEGDLLFTLDTRQIDAQIEQAEGTLAKDQAQLEGAQRDLRRYTDLVGKGATTQVNVDNAKTQSDILTAHHQGRSGRARQSEGPEELHPDPRAVHGPHQRRQCEDRQFRAAGRYPAACRHQPDGAGLRDLRGSAARAGRSARVHGQGRLQGDRDHSRPAAFRERQGRDGRKHRRCHHRHGHRARHHGQRERDAVAGHAGGDQADHPHRRCRRGADGRGAAQPERQFRLRRQGRRGQGPAGQGRPHRRRACR